MPNTANKALPYPSATSSVNVSGDIQALANAVDAAITYPATVAANDGVITDGTVSSAYPTFSTAVGTLGVLGVVFTAPASGKVKVFCHTGEARNSTAGLKVLMDFIVFAGASIGTGTVVRAAQSYTAGSSESEEAAHNREVNTFDLVSGLTPGAQYNACLAYCVTGATGTINRRNIMVEPVIS